MTAVNTTLYGKQGDSKFEIHPATVAEQVSVADEAGGSSTVADEIVKLRQQISAAVNQGIHFKGLSPKTMLCRQSLTKPVGSTA